MIILLNSCNYEQNKKKGYTVIEEINSSSFYISDIKIDTAAYEDFLSGIRITLKISHEAITADDNSLKRFGDDCTGYEVNIQLCDINGKLIPRVNDNFDSLSNSNLSSQNIVSVPEKSTSSFFFPYRSIGMPKGPGEIMLTILTYPAYSIDDTLYNTVSKRKSGKPDISLKIKTKITFPEIHTARFYVKEFFLDTTKFNPSACDVHIFGPGYPDPMFRIFSKDHLIYSSNYFKNSLYFRGPEVTQEIKFTAKDCFTLKILDYDSWGQSDMLAEITASPDWISHDSLKLSTVKFGNLKYLKIATVIK